MACRSNFSLIPTFDSLREGNRLLEAQMKVEDAARLG
jgi:hypothetical protein